MTKPVLARAVAALAACLVFTMPFEDAIKAALETKPPEKKPRKPRAKKVQPSGKSS